ncbi:MAG TPA: C1 family peptidase [Methanospirillum sp.]|nr:C1 family peptidase [Methanospirillum sp.]
MQAPLISGDDNALIGGRPIVQPLFTRITPSPSPPGASSGQLSLVQRPISGNRRCTTCETAGSNKSAGQPDLARISADEELRNIAYINANISREGGDWVAGHTSVSNLTPDAFDRLLGAVPPTGVMTALSLPLPEISAEALPSSFSWKSNGGDYTTPIRDQARCGSCWAFAGTAVFESFWERLSQNPNLNPDFSEQYLVSCNRDGDDCGGGWNPLSYFISRTGASGGIGTVLESAYPYTASDTSCKDLSAYTRYKAPAGTAWYTVDGYTIPSDTQIKTAVYTYGPLWVSLGVTNDFSYYDSGVYSYSGSVSINHAVALVGWGTQSDGRTYWICKNSWGTGWGEDGWFNILSGSNLIGYAAAYMTNPDLPAPIVSSITPSDGKTGSLVQITNLAGSNFVPDARVNLTKTGYANVTLTNVQLVSPTQITGSMNLAGKAPGTWNVVVINPDGKIGRLANGFTVLPNITARFFGVPGTSVFPYTVQFYDVSEGNPVSWSWTFGDGGENTTRNPSHTYNQAGTYTVQLTVSDGYGSSSMSTDRPRDQEKI